MLKETCKLAPDQEKRFAELLDETYRKVFNMAFRLSGSRADAEDLTQEAFVRAYRSFHDFEGDRPFENWIYRIVTRLYLDLLRNRRRRIQAVSFDAPLPHVDGTDGMRFDVPDQGENPEERLLRSTFSEDLEAVLASLTAEQRLLVMLADVEGLPYREIAEVIGKPVGTVRSRLHRTHKAIRSRLESRRTESGTAVTPNCLRLAMGS